MGIAPEVEKYASMLDDMRHDYDFEFAGDTIDGILTHIKNTATITKNQMEAVDNILDSKPDSYTYDLWRN